MTTKKREEATQGGVGGQQTVTFAFPAMFFEASMARIEDIKLRIIALHWLSSYFNQSSPWGEEDKKAKAREGFHALHDYFFAELSEAYESLMASALFSDGGEIVKEVRKETYENYLMKGKALAAFFRWEELPARQVLEGYGFCGLSGRHNATWVNQEMEKELNEFIKSLYEDEEEKKKSGKLHSLLTDLHNWLSKDRDPIKWSVNDKDEKYVLQSRIRDILDEMEESKNGEEHE